MSNMEKINEKRNSVVLDVRQIRQYTHAYLFLLVINYSFGFSGRGIIGQKNVTINEEFFKSFSFSSAYARSTYT